MRNLKQTAPLLSGVLLLALLSGCAATDMNSPEGIAMRCGEAAYDAIFYGGSYYDYQKRSTVSSILRSEAGGGGTVSDRSLQGIINEVGEDAARGVAEEFNNCIDEAPAAG